MRAALAAFALTLATAGVAAAQAPSRDDVRDTASSQEASHHFEAALVYYRAGKYRAAIVELEKAYGVDPTGKDLVYNLAVVYEKLGELKAAIHYLERYVALEPDPEEIQRANDAIQRLRGAQRELAERTAPAPAKPCPPAPPEPPPKPPGRFDGWVAATGGVAVLSAVVGTVLGVSALSTNPSADDATGSGESREERRERAASAKELALLADVAFAISLVSGSAAAVLYFGRTPGPQAEAVVGVVGRF